MTQKTDTSFLAADLFRDRGGNTEQTNWGEWALVFKSAGTTSIFANQSVVNSQFNLVSVLWEGARLAVTWFLL